MTRQAVLAAAESPTWTAVILAVLGSSALGAIIGGVLTTSLRGRIERDEAWRTRLLDAAAALSDALAALLLEAGDLKRAFHKDREAADLRLTAEAWARARTAQTLVSLLFGQESATTRTADSVLRLERDMRRAMRGQMDRIENSDWLNITPATDQGEAVDALYYEAAAFAGRFSDAANREIRSARSGVSRRMLARPRRG